MPTWLCAAVLDVVFSQRYAGWDHSLNVFGYLVQGAVEFDLARYAIVDDDVDALHRLFQERRCRPRDRLVWQNMGVEDSLLEVSELGLLLVHQAIKCDSKAVAAVC